jgi:hypothetical protein
MTCGIVKDIAPTQNFSSLYYDAFIYLNDAEADGKPASTIQCHVKRSGTKRVTAAGSSAETPTDRNKTKTIQTSITDLRTQPQRYSNTNVEMLFLYR